MHLDDLRVFHNSMIGFDKNEIILVIYDNLTNTIQYYQNTVNGNKTVFTSQINYMYFPADFRYGILTPEGYEHLMEGLEILSTLGNDSKLMTNMGKLETSFYQVPDGNGQFNPGPQLIRKLNFVTFSNPIVIRIILRLYSQASRLLIRKIKYDKKHKDDKIDSMFKEHMDSALAPKSNPEKLNKR